MKIRWDSTRFEGNVYAIVGKRTIARILHYNGIHYDVVPCPDAPPAWYDVKDGIAMDSFKSLKAAKIWIEEYARSHSLRV